MEVENSEAVTYSEFSNSLSNPVLLGVVNFDPMPGSIIIELATNVIYGRQTFIRPSTSPTFILIVIIAIISLGEINCAPKQKQSVEAVRWS